MRHSEAAYRVAGGPVNRRKVGASPPSEAAALLGLHTLWKAGWKDWAAIQMGADDSWDRGVSCEDGKR